MFAIQDAFATAIRTDAVFELNKVKEIYFMHFISWNGELAPEGFKWDTSDRLISIKENKKTLEK